MCVADHRLFDIYERSERFEALCLLEHIFVLSWIFYVFVSELCEPD